jgi:hypothetical protein
MSDQQLQWVIAYFVVPFVLFAVVRTYTFFKLGAKESPFKEESVLFNMGATIAAIALWPLVALGFAIGAVLESPQFLAIWRPKWFHCQRKHLLGSVTVEDAEASAKVVDPLHRAPDLPFGHLNPAWQAFLKQRRFGYRLKSFSIPGTSPDALHAGAPRWSTPLERKLGYAWVWMWQVKAEFIYEWD